MTWEECLTFVKDTFTSDDSSGIHARLRLDVRDTTHPAMVWQGKSTAYPENEVVHIASPICPAEDADLAHLARQADELPLGALRIMSDTVHIHQALPLAHLETARLAASVRLIVAEALTLSQEA
ncbi:MAG: hypothetical protein QM705_09140 [Ancrocorticia sp.]